MNEANVTRRTLSVLVENAAGVLSQVSRLFSRKGYNIESLAVGTTDDPAVSRITIEVLADEGCLNVRFKRMAIPDIYVHEVGDQQYLRERLGLTAPAVEREILRICQE